MRLDLVAAWALSLPIGSASPVVATSSTTSEHLASLEAPVHCPPNFSLQSDLSRTNPSFVNCVPLDNRSAAFTVPVDEEEEEYVRPVNTRPAKQHSGISKTATSC